MQANATHKRFDRGQFKATALAIGIAVSVVLGMGAAVAIRHDDARISPATSDGVASPTGKDFRFMEANELPAAPAVVQLPSYRFLEQNVWSTTRSHGDVAAQAAVNHMREINILPGDDAPQLPPTSARGARF